MIAIRNDEKSKTNRKIQARSSIPPSSHHISRGAHPDSHKWSLLLKTRSLTTTIPGLSLDLHYRTEIQKQAVELWCRVKVKTTWNGLRRHVKKGIKGCFVCVMTWKRSCSLQQPITGFILVQFNGYLKSLHQQMQLSWLPIILADRELEMDANYCVCVRAGVFCCHCLQTSMI